MAARGSKKVSRRKALALLGSGTAAGVLWGPEPTESSEAMQGGGLDCTTAAQTTVKKIRVGPKQLTVLVCDSCCVPTSTMVLKPRNLTAVNKRHLKPIVDDLERLIEQNALDEYCFMIWGITDTQRILLRKQIADQLTAWNEAK